MAGMMRRKTVPFIQLFYYFSKRSITTKTARNFKNTESLRLWYSENNILYGPLLDKNKRGIVLDGKNKGDTLSEITETSWFGSKSSKVFDDELSSISSNQSSDTYNSTYSNRSRENNQESQDFDAKVFATSRIHNDLSSLNPAVSSVENLPQKINSGNVHSIHNKLELIKLAPLCRTQADNQELTDLSQFLVNDSLISVPSVTRILSSTKSPESEMILERWKKKMIGEMGEAEFKQYQEDTLRRGTNFHSCIQSFFSGTDVADIQLDDDNRGHWDSVQRVLGNVVDVVCSETRVVHPYLQYCGMFDCLATYTVKNTMCVIDWKTSQKPKPHLSYTYDHPLQAAAYLGALNHDVNQDIKISSALIVIAYNDGSNAHAHYMDEQTCRKYWKQWLDRLQLYWTRVLVK